MEIKARQQNFLKGKFSQVADLIIVCTFACNFFILYEHFYRCKILSDFSCARKEEMKKVWKIGFVLNFALQQSCAFFTSMCKLCTLFFNFYVMNFKDGLALRISLWDRRLSWHKFLQLWTWIMFVNFIFFAFLFFSFHKFEFEFLARDTQRKMEKFEMKFEKLRTCKLWILTVLFPLFLTAHFSTADSFSRIVTFVFTLLRSKYGPFVGISLKLSVMKSFRIDKIEI